MVDELLDVVHREKVPAHVEHTSAVSEIRLVGDFDNGQLDNAGFLAPGARGSGNSWRIVWNA